MDGVENNPEGEVEEKTMGHRDEIGPAGLAGDSSAQDP